MKLTVVFHDVSLFSALKRIQHSEAHWEWFHRLGFWGTATHHNGKRLGLGWGVTFQGVNRWVSLSCPVGAVSGGSVSSQVVDIMRMNVDKVLERDQKLSELDNRADALQAGASQFETSAAKLKRKYWWKNCKVRNINSCLESCHGRNCFHLHLVGLCLQNGTSESSLLVKVRKWCLDLEAPEVKQLWSLSEPINSAVYKM